MSAGIKRAVGRMLLLALVVVLAAGGYVALNSDAEAMVKHALARHGKVLDFVLAVNIRQGEKDKALLQLAGCGDEVYVRKLLKAGANPDVVGADGMTPLGKAMAAGRTHNARALLEAGAKPLEPDRGAAGAKVYRSRNTADSSRAMLNMQVEK